MRAMLFLLVCLAVPAYGQSTLPPCDPNVAVASWTNCQGTFTHANGNKYVGQARDDKSNGQGIPSLPIHDALYVQARNASQAKEALESSWMEEVGVGFRPVTKLDYLSVCGSSS